MNKNHNLYNKKTLSFFVVILLLGNFIAFTTSLGHVSEESLNSEQKSQDEFNFYKGVNCTKLGEYDSNYGVPYEMIIAEHSFRTLAFVRENYGILVVDISDPEQPFFVNHYFERESFSAFHVSDNYLYLVNNSYNLLIYNIQDLSNPLLTFNGFIEKPYDFSDLFVQDDILYAGVRYEGLAIYNLSFPWNPQFISQYRHDLYIDYFFDFVIRDNFAFLCRGNVFQIVNLTDIHNPNVSGVFIADWTYADFRNIFISDDKAVICADDGYFYILNISDLTNPTQITYIWDYSHYFRGFYLDGSIGYLLSFYEGLSLINLTNLPHIEYIHKEYNRGNYQSLGFHDGHPILLDSQEGIEIYKVNEDYSTELISRFWDGGFGVDVVVSENHAYVANSNNGLEIYKIRNSLTPEFRSRINLGSSCRNVYVNENLAYVIDHDQDYLYTIDVSNKRKPKILSYQDMRIEIDNSTYYPSNFEFSGDQALVSYYGASRYLAFLDLSNSSGFQVSELLPVEAYIYDIAYNPPYLYLLLDSRSFSIYHKNESETEWNLLTNTDIDIYTWGFSVSENFVFFAGTNNLRIFDISNPLAPTETAVFYGFNNTYDGYDVVVVESDIAYLIGENNRDLHILNVQDKEHPYIEGTFSCNETLIDLFVKDDVVYLTGSLVNLEIIQLDRFISLLNYVIYTPIAGIAALIGVPIIIVVSVRARRRREAIKNMPTTQMLPREEIQDPKQDHENETSLRVSPDDFDDPKLLALAKKIVEAAEKDSK